MKFDVVTIFPDLINQNLNFGIIGRAINEEKIQVSTHDPRKYSSKPTKRIDDKPYGGGPGMVMEAEPIIKAIEKAKQNSKKPYVVYVSPQGSLFDQNKAIKLSKEKHLIFISGRYEGIDQRVIDYCVDEEISVGDYVLSGGELPCLLLIDSISRQIKGVLGDYDSVEKDSFYDGLLKHPQFTRPESSKYGKVPKVLLSGDHETIRLWKKKQSLLNTITKRPELLKDVGLSDEEKNLLDEIKKDEEKT